jgi:cytoskeletal protein RodZ
VKTRAYLKLSILILLTLSFLSLPTFASAETANQRHQGLKQKMEDVRERNEESDRAEEEKAAGKKKEKEEKAASKSDGSTEEKPKSSASRATVYCKAGKVVFPKNPTEEQKQKCAK